MNTKPNQSPTPKAKRTRKRAPENTAAETGAPSDQSTPQAIRGKLAVLAAGAGLEVPAEAGQRPAVDMAQPLQSLARELGMLASRENLFLQNGRDLVTVDSGTGKTQAMDPPRFCSWVETMAWPYRTGRGDSLSYARTSADTARLILASDEFRRHIRPLRGVSQVRLPVWKEDGKPESGLELMRPGYHAPSEMFCCDLVPFDAKAKPDDARRWFLQTFKDFPFDSERSRAAFAVLMLQPFARLLLPRGEKLMHGVFIAAESGSGKTLLIVAALAPVFGRIAVVSPGKTEEELRAILDTAAIERHEFLALDDIGSLRSKPLNSFMTSSHYRPRIKGKSESREVDLDCMVMLSGIGVDVGREIARRCLIVDLFQETDNDGEERKFEQVVSQPWFSRPDVRAKSLAFLYSLLRHWCDTGRLVDPEAKRGGFESASSLCGSVVRAAALGRPFAPRLTTIGGDEEGDALRSLIRAAAERVHPEGGEYRPADLVTLADDLGLTDAIAPYAKHPAKLVGMKLRVWRGKQVKDSQGRLFQFGDDPRKGRVRKNGHSVYRIQYIGKA